MSGIVAAPPPNPVMDAIIAFGEAHPAILQTLIIVGLFFAYYLLTPPTVPYELPWIYKPRSWGPLAESRAAWASLYQAKHWIVDGYRLYSKRGISYVYPEFSGRPEIVIPRSQLKWLLDKPDTVVSAAEAHYDLLAGSYNFTDPTLLQTMFHEKVLHKSMYRNLGGLMPEIWDELQTAISSHFGTEPGASKTIILWRFRDIIARASNRMFVGLPLCRNEAYLSDMIGFGDSVIRCMTLLTFVPSLLHPLFGRLFSIPNNRHHERVKQLTIPVIKQRLADILAKKAVANDYMTWHIKLAVAEANDDELQPDKIARRLLPINFAAIHTTTMALANIVLDIASSEPSVLAGLREEAERVYADCGGCWDKTAMNKMMRTDSAIRESLRFSNFAARGIFRKVIGKNGVKNEAEGWIAPEGSFISVDAHGVHHDEEVYANANVYDAFRFSREREREEAMENEGVRNDDKGGEKDEMEEEGKEKEYKERLIRLKSASAGLITTSDTFLPFGHGRHACPGRFFINHELKMLLAYVVMNYEIEHLATRPQNRWMASTSLPPMDARIRVTRRRMSGKEL